MRTEVSATGPHHKKKIRVLPMGPGGNISFSGEVHQEALTPPCNQLNLLPDWRTQYFLDVDVYRDAFLI